MRRPKKRVLKKEKYQKAKCRRTFFHDTNSFDPIYYPNHAFVEKKVGAMCLAFNKQTKRSDHRFLGLPKNNSSKPVPTILKKLRNNNITKK